jgi:dipeptidyl aminopeptidase/acylaminoacyl peptidase
MARQLYFLSCLLLGAVLFSNCSKESTDTPSEQVKDIYLDSYTFVRSVTAQEVTNLFSPVQSVYPEVSGILPFVKSGVKVYSVRYNTTLGNKKLIASGLVCIPDGGGTYPILSFQNGTNTVYANAPSLSATSFNGQMISGFAATGFVVVLPDYLGFGSSTEVFHPYLVAEGTVGPILDLFRAVKEMGSKADLNVKISKDLYIMGYSQGGLSTLQLHKAIETSFGSEFNLKAVGCGAGPYNLPLITQSVLSLNYYPQPYYIAYIMKGFRSVGSFTNPYTDIFNEPYASRIDGLFNGINSGNTINEQLSYSIPQLFTADFRTNFATSAKYKGMMDALTASSVSAWKVKTPLILIHGQADTDVSPLMSSQLYSDLMKLDPSLPVTYIPLAGLDHGGASAPALVKFVSRFLVIRGN